MDVEQKKIEVKESIARGPETIVFARIEICDVVQLADEMKVQFTSFFRQAANTAVGASNTNTLHEVCINLAKQRALLHGANVGTIMGFNIGGLTPASGSFNTAIYTATGALTFPLSKLVKKITAVEIDPMLTHFLKQSKIKNISIINEDFMKWKHDLTSKIKIDGNTFNKYSSEQVQNYLGLQYYIFYLEKTD